MGLRGVLVVWYSRGGRTAQVGEELARALHADREPIREGRAGSGLDEGVWVKYADVPAAVQDAEALRR